MKTTWTAVGLLLILIPFAAIADPIAGIFRSTDLGGQILTGRATIWRPAIDGGLPNVLHAESYDPGTAQLGTQWEMSCAVATAPATIQDNRVSGTGTVVSTSKFSGGVFTYFAGSPAWPWGDGSGTLGTTTLITTTQYVSNVPVASVINGNTGGLFSNGCALVFAISNGSGVGETPFASKPSDYPSFIDDGCAPAPASEPYGIWESVITITIQIDCVTPTRTPTWGALKTRYR